MEYTIVIIINFKFHIWDEEWCFQNFWTLGDLKLCKSHLCFAQFIAGSWRYQGRAAEEVWFTIYNFWWVQLFNNYDFVLVLTVFTFSISSYFYLVQLISVLFPSGIQFYLLIKNQRLGLAHYVLQPNHSKTVILFFPKEFFFWCS